MECKSCHAPIYWGETENLRTAPFDVVEGVRTRTNHFATCPHARQWSRRKPRERS